MNLNELFEATIPPHIKPSDIPPTMRNRKLTMRDIEAEKPASVYRFRVGDKNFMDLNAAQDFATGTGQKVERIAEEQLDEQEVDVPASMNPENRGALVLTALEKDKEFARMSRRPIRIRMGGEQFVITEPEVKNMILTMAAGYKKKGTLPQFLLNLGQPDSLNYLLGKLEKSDVGVAGQGATPRAPRYARESQLSKKKDNITEKEQFAGLTPQAARIMQQVRQRQPQAQGDIEALTYDYDVQQQRDRADIKRLDKEQDELEADIKQDIQKTLGRLRGRKGTDRSGLDQIERNDRAQNAAIQKILQLDKEQQQAIDDLEKAMQEPGKAVKKTAVTAPADKSTDTAKTAVRGPRVAKTLRRPPSAEPGISQRATVASPAVSSELPSNVFKLTPAPRGAIRKTKKDDSEVKPSKDTKTLDLFKTGTLGESPQTQGVAVRRDEKENIILDEAGKDACYHKVRSRYKVWPSAYASGALVQCRKKGAANWGTGGKKK